MWLLFNLIASILVPGILPVVIVSGLAGRWDLWNVWAYSTVSAVLLVFQTLVISVRSPALLKARMVDAGGSVRLRADRAFVLLSILQWICAGLDQHFHWSDFLPAAAVVIGLVLVSVSWALTTWSVWVNSFFSPAVRIQEERGQRLISEGPYAIVRHPGYLGIALSMFASALALNSLWSIIPAILYLWVTIRQTAIEDRMLADRLPGYPDYQTRVRYRLLPGIW